MVLCTIFNWFDTGKCADRCAPDITVVRSTIYCRQSERTRKVKLEDVKARHSAGATWGGKFPETGALGHAIRRAA